MDPLRAAPSSLGRRGGRLPPLAGRPRYHAGMPVRSSPPVDLDWDQVIALVDAFLRGLSATAPLTQSLRQWNLIAKRSKLVLGPVAAAPTRPSLDDLLVLLRAYCEVVHIPFPRDFNLTTVRGIADARTVAQSLRHRAQLAQARKVVHGQGQALSLAHLHPLVWTPAVQDQWRAGKRRLALQEAAHALELVLQSKTGSGSIDPADASDCGEQGPEGDDRCGGRRF